MTGGKAEKQKAVKGSQPYEPNQTPRDDTPFGTPAESRSTVVISHGAHSAPAAALPSVPKMPALAEPVKPSQDLDMHALMAAIANVGSKIDTNNARLERMEANFVSKSDLAALSEKHDELAAKVSQMQSAPVSPKIAARLTAIESEISNIKTRARAASVPAAPRTHMIASQKCEENDEQIAASSPLLDISFNKLSLEQVSMQTVTEYMNKIGYSGVMPKLAKQPEMSNDGTRIRVKFDCASSRIAAQDCVRVKRDGGGFQYKDPDVKMYRVKAEYEENRDKPLLGKRLQIAGQLKIPKTDIKLDHKTRQLVHVSTGTVLARQNLNDWSVVVEEDYLNCKTK